MNPPDADFDPYRKWLAVADPQRPPNHYRLLGLEPFESDTEVIENAADARMALVRTFAGGRHGILSQRILNELAVARVCLLSAKRREAYDAKLKAEGVGGSEAALRPVPPPLPAQTPPPPPVTPPPIAEERSEASELPKFGDDSSVIIVAADVLAEVADAESVDLPPPASKRSATPTRSAVTTAPRGTTSSPRPTAPNPALLLGGIGGGAVLLLVVLAFALSSGGKPTKPTTKPAGTLASLDFPQPGAVTAETESPEPTRSRPERFVPAFGSGNTPRPDPPETPRKPWHWPSDPRGPAAQEFGPVKSAGFTAKAGVIAARFTSGETVAAVDWRGNVYLTGPGNASPQPRYRIAGEPLVAALVLPRLKRILAAGADGTLRLVGLESGREYTELERVTTDVRGLIASRDETMLAVIDAEGRAFMYRLDRGRLLERVPRVDEPIRGIAFKEDDPQRFAIATARNVHLRTISRLYSGRSWNAVDGTWTRVAWRADPLLISVVDERGRLNFWQNELDSAPVRREAGCGPLLAVASHPFAPLVAVAGSGIAEPEGIRFKGDASLEVYDLTNAAPRLKLVGHRDAVLCLDFEPEEGRLLVSAGLDGQVRWWRLPEPPARPRGNRIAVEFDFYPPAQLFPGPNVADLPLATGLEKLPKPLPAETEPAPRQMPKAVAEWADKFPPRLPSPLFEPEDLAVFTADYAPRLLDKGKPLGRDEQNAVAKSWLTEARGLAAKRPGLARCLLVRAFAAASEGKGDAALTFEILKEFETRSETVSTDLQLAVRTVRGAMIRELLLLLRRLGKQVDAFKVFLADAELSRLESLLDCGFWDDARKGAASAELVDLVRGAPGPERAERLRRLKTRLDANVADRAKLTSLSEAWAKTKDGPAAERLGVYLLTQLLNPVAAKDFLLEGSETWKNTAYHIGKAQADAHVWRDVARRTEHLLPLLETTREKAGWLILLEDVLRGSREASPDARVRGMHDDELRLLEAERTKLPAAAVAEIGPELHPQVRRPPAP